MLKQYRNLIFIVFLLSLPLITMSSHRTFSKNWKWYHKAVSTVTYPLQLISSRVLDASIKGVEGYVASVFTVPVVKHLERENIVLRSQIAQLSEISEENKRLRNLLQFKSQIPDNVLPARIVAWDAVSEFQSIRIDKGSDEGILTGMAVVSPEGIVGNIFHVAASHSVVLLVTDPLSKVDSILQRSRARGIVQGLSGLSAEVKYLDRTDDIRIGDLVVTSGFGGYYPKAVQVGQISHVYKKRFGVTQKVILHPSVDFSKLEEVLIILSDNMKTRDSKLAETPADDTETKVKTKTP